MKSKNIIFSLLTSGVAVLCLPVSNAAGSVHCFGPGCASSYALPDTGQTTCWGASGSVISCSGAGQDGSYNPSTTQQSHTDNGDGTVTDNRTGLMWKKCSEPDTTTGCSGAHLSYTWVDAISACEGLTYPSGSYSDWRLPNAMELFSIGNQQGTWPFIDQTAFPNIWSSYYWTGTTYVPSPAYALSVDFGSGFVVSNPKTGSKSVLCVRAGP